MKKIIASLLLFTTIVLLTPVGPQAFAQQNIAANTLGCTLSGLLATATANAQIIAAPTATSVTQFINGASTSITTTKSIKVCSVFVSVKQAAGAADFNLISGTGTNCATGAANVTTPKFGTASVVDNFQQEYGQGSYLVVPAGKALCLKVSATPTNASATILYKLE
jgi:hypothetical protein